MKWRRGAVGAVRACSVPPAKRALTALTAGLQFAALAFTAPVHAAPAAFLTVDDGYTVSQRYYAYREQYPQLQLPELSFQPGQQVLFDRLYKKLGDRELHVDVFLPNPARATRRALLLVHGGGWRAGNKSNFYAMANKFAQRGYAVFTPEFRLSLEAKYPAALVDINDALLWVKAHAEEFGVDPAQIAIGGESTGGHMAALVAYTADRDLYKSQPGDDTRVSAFIDLDGILDPTTPLALKFENAAGEKSVAAQWLGGSMQRAPARWRDANAAAYVGPRSPPTLVIASAEPRFTAGVETVLPALRSHGIPAEKVDFPNTPHAFWLFEPYLTQIVEKVDAFLQAAHPDEHRYAVRSDCNGAPRCYATIQAAVDAASSAMPKPAAPPAGGSPAIAGAATASVATASAASTSAANATPAHATAANSGASSAGPSTSGPSPPAADDGDANASAAASLPWARIDIAPGNYSEKVTLTRPRTRLHGAGAANTFLRFDAVAQTAAKYHRDGWGTAGSATLTIDADDVIVDGITIENTWDYLSNDALRDDDPRKIQSSQALAVLLDRHSDRVLIEDAELLGYQDTLYAHGRRALVRRSVIAGNVDFIFGDGRLLIEDSTIRTRPRSAANPGEFQSMVTAPSTQRAQPSGIVIHRSKLTRERGVPDASVALGRPWHPTRNFPNGRYADPEAVGQASFIDCWFDAHIHPDHWTSMLGTARDGTKTHVFAPQDARFFESGSQGPGARRNDIGLRWNEALSIEQVEKLMFEGWPEAQRSR